MMAGLGKQSEASGSIQLTEIFAENLAEIVRENSEGMGSSDVIVINPLHHAKLRLANGLGMLTAENVNKFYVALLKDTTESPAVNQLVIDCAPVSEMALGKLEKNNTMQKLKVSESVPIDNVRRDLIVVMRFKSGLVGDSALKVDKLVVPEDYDAYQKDQKIRQLEGQVAKLELQISEALEKKTADSDKTACPDEKVKSVHEICEQNVATLQDTIAKFKESNDGWQTTYAEMKRNYTLLMASHAKLKAERNALFTEVTALRASNEGGTDAPLVATLRQAKSELEHTLAEMTDALAKSQEEIKILNQALDEKSSQLMSAQSEEARLSEELNDAVGNYKYVNDQLNACKLQLAETESQLLASTSALDELRKMREEAMDFKAQLEVCAQEKIVMEETIQNQQMLLQGSEDELAETKIQLEEAMDFKAQLEVCVQEKIEMAEIVLNLQTSLQTNEVELAETKTQLETEIAQLKSKLEECGQVRKDVTGDLSDVQKLLESKDDEIRTVREYLDRETMRWETQLQECKEDKVKLDDELRATHRLLEAAQTELKGVKATLQTSVNPKVYDDLRAETARLRELYAKKAGELEDLESEFARAKLDLEEMKAKYEGLQRDYEEKNREMENLAVLLEECRAELSQAEKGTEQKNPQLEMLQAKYDRCAAELAVAQSELTGLKRMHEDVTNALLEQKALAEERQRNIQELTSVSEEMRVALEQTTSELETSKTRIAELETNCAAIKKERDEVKASLLVQKQNVKNTQDRLAELKSKAEDYARQIQYLEKERVAQQGKITELEGKLVSTTGVAGVPNTNSPSVITALAQPKPPPTSSQGLGSS